MPKECVHCANGTGQYEGVIARFYIFLHILNCSLGWFYLCVLIYICFTIIFPPVCCVCTVVTVVFCYIFFQLPLKDTYIQTMVAINQINICGSAKKVGLSQKGKNFRKQRVGEEVTETNSGWGPCNKRSTKSHRESSLATATCLWSEDTATTWSEAVQPGIQHILGWVNIDLLLLKPP